MEPEKKVVGQGTCEVLSQKGVDKNLKEFGSISYYRKFILPI